MPHSQTLASRLLEHLVTPTFVLNLEGEVIVWNKACEQLTGTKRSDVLGTKDHWRAFYKEKRETLADIVLQGSDQKLKELYANHLLSKGEIKHTIHAENWAQMPALVEAKYLSIDAGPVFDKTGNLEAVVETIQDLTELKKIQESLTQLATSDSLTGLGNRRLFDGQLQNYWYNARRHREKVSLLLIDVDYFKKYNDIYGHQQGDQILSRLGLTLNTSVHRGSDQCFRYGGEEFAVLLPDTGPDGAIEVAERIRERLYDLHIPHKGSNQYQRLTLSLGVATASPDARSDPSELVKHADEALYASKAAGRNRSTVYTEESD